jgi:hypothetical protein
MSAAWEMVEPVAAPTFTVTVFRDFLALVKEERTVTVAAFVEMVKAESAARKRDLPWAKLPTFGDVKTERGCLRSNENMKLVHGVECDYDGEVVPFDEAVARARDAGVLTILYTSPSHTPDKPRWRAIHPFSGPKEPAGRAGMMDRANGIFGGVLNGESWTDSQSYYFGRVNDHFRIEVVEGDFIDARPDIVGIGKPAASATEINAYAEGSPISIEEFRAAGAAAAIGAAELSYDKLMPLIAATARVNVVGDDDRAIRLEVAKAIRDATPGSNMDAGRFEAAFNAPIREDQKTANPGTFFYYAKLGDWVPAVGDEGVTIDDFRAYMPTHNYIFMPTGAFWPAGSVNSQIPPVPLLKANGEPLLDEKGKPVKIPASTWLDKHKHVEMMTWVPGEPMIVPDKLALVEGGWVERRGVSTFNLYRPPTVKPGDADQAGRWVAHVRLVYPNEAEHIINWMAHRVQKPGDKINHAIVLGGEQGIGKDTFLEPLKYAVGPWNFAEVTPEIVLTPPFNGYLKSVVLRISEARDTGDFDRFRFYDHMKVYTAAPPDMLRVNEKHIREYPVANVCGVVITTNHKLDGIYLPADDRRHFVAWSERTKDDYQDRYWSTLWEWYASGGIGHVVAYLQQRDISGWDAKAPPPKTEAFWEIVNASRPAEEPELADAIDRLGEPEAFWLGELENVIWSDFKDWLRDRKNRRIIPHRLEKCGYVPVRNPDANDGQWKVSGSRRTIYAKKELSISKQLESVKKRIAAASKLPSHEEMDGVDGR